MKRLLQVGPDQPDDIRTRLIEALREAVDAVPEVIRRLKDALPRLTRNAGAGCKRARYRRARNASTSCDVGGCYKGTTHPLFAHGVPLLHTCASNPMPLCTRVQHYDLKGMAVQALPTSPAPCRQPV